MLRQAYCPGNVHFLVYEEVTDKHYDTLYYYKKNKNTVEDYAQNVHVLTKPFRKRPPGLGKVVSSLVAAARKRRLFKSRDTFLWIDTAVTFVAPEWDRVLQGLDVQHKMVTSVPSDPKQQDPLPRFPFVNEKGRIRSQPFFKKNTTRCLKTPVAHPYFVFGSVLSLTRSLSTANTHRPSDLERHLGPDFAPTALFGQCCDFYVLPRPLCKARLLPSRLPPRKKHKQSFWQQWLQQNTGVDLYNGRVSAHIQLGMWPPGIRQKGSDAERLLGILVRHGSENEYNYKLNKMRALRSGRSTPVFPHKKKKMMHP